MKKTLSILLLGCLAVSLPGQELLERLNPDNIEKEFLGEKTITFRGERDEIRVGLVDGFFRRLMIEVVDNDVRIEKMIVVYGNNARDEIPLRHVFREGSRSRIIDLEGRRRVIKKVIFFYKTVGRLVDGRATLKLYGIK
jgi:hypothetical protein